MNLSTTTPAKNLDRRAWFSALLPMAGEGLVKLLRASNNLQRDVHDAMKERAGNLLSEDTAADPEKKISD